MAVTPQPEIVVDPSPCTIGWAGCRESYTGGHSCERKARHAGRHRCVCGATKIRRQRMAAPDPRLVARIERIENILAVAWAGTMTETDNIDPNVQRAQGLLRDIRYELGYPSDYDPTRGL